MKKQWGWGGVFLAQCQHYAPSISSQAPVVPVPAYRDEGLVCEAIASARGDTKAKACSSIARNCVKLTPLTTYASIGAIAPYKPVQDRTVYVLILRNAC